MFIYFVIHSARSTQSTVFFLIFISLSNQIFISRINGTPRLILIHSKNLCYVIKLVTERNFGCKKNISTISTFQTIEYYSIETYNSTGHITRIIVSTKHINLFCQDYIYNPITKILTGTWEQGNLFNIQLIDNVGYVPTFDNIKFFIIPEPMTVLILGFGLILLRSNK